MILIAFERFEKLEPEKKQKIINAGFMVFAKHGYTKTSVEEIITAAGIAKGSLYYYFESKKNFYLYLYHYCAKQLELLVDSPGPDGKPVYMAYHDFFERLNIIQMLKSKHSANYPYMSSFAKKAVLDTSPVVREELSKVNTVYTQKRAMLFFQDVDYSKFREGIDPSMVLQLLTWTSEGCANQIMLKSAKNNSSSAEDIAAFKEIYSLYQSYVELFRKAFYKEEYL